MNIDDIESARAAFSKFEGDMTGSEAKNALREGLDHALDVIENPRSDAKRKRVAQNLIASHRRRLSERIVADLDDTRSLGDDSNSHWFSLVVEFEDADCDEDKTLSRLKIRLLEKDFYALRKVEQSDLLRCWQCGAAANM